MTNVLNTPWRLTASTIYKKPYDSKILGSVDIDVTDLEKYIAELRKRGTKITLTHFLTLVTAKAIATEIPEFNSYVKRGNFYQFKELVASISIKLPNGDMSSVKVTSPEKMNYSQIVEQVSQNLAETIKGAESKANKMKDALAYIPWPFRRWVFSLIKFIILTLGIPLPFIGMNAQSFGTFFVSNIGTLGLDGGYPALLPTGNISLVLIVGRVRDLPWVVDGQVVPRRILKLGAALDHRIIDASHGGKLFNYIRRVIRNPEMFE